MKKNVSHRILRFGLVVLIIALASPSVALRSFMDSFSYSIFHAHQDIPVDQEDGGSTEDDGSDGEGDYLIIDPLVVSPSLAVLVRGSLTDKSSWIEYCLEITVPPPRS